MAPRRRSNPTLAMSRIYVRRQRYYLFAKDPVRHPETGKVAKWHSLCSLAEGELVARQRAAAIMAGNRAPGHKGDLPGHIKTYELEVLRRREKRRPKEEARERIFKDGNAKIESACGIISEALRDFDVDQVIGVDVARFVDQWAGRRAAQAYLGRLNDFFRWAIRRGLRADNPCANISVEKPEKRRRYLEDAEWHAARDALLVGKDNKPTASGPMVQCYVDLCYLLYQRATEIRLLKWSQIDLEGGVINFTPTKTEYSSGASVAVPITPAVRAVLATARSLGKVKGVYVIHTARGKAYTANGIGSAWRRACERATIEDATLKDIRAKAATDARKAGYSKEQIRDGLAHTDVGMTEHYLRGKEIVRSTVELALPARKAS